MASITEYLASIGCHTIDTSYRSYIDEWVEWYQGKVDNFHKYNVFNGIQQVGVERKRLDMAKTVCEDWANLLLNERARITVEGEGYQKPLNALLTANNFAVRGNRLIEKAFATGTGAFSEYKDAQGMPCLDTHDARCVWPLKWSNGEITECAFSSVEVVDNKKAIYLRIYRDNPDGTQRIENHYLDYESGKPITSPDGILPVVDTGIKVRLFQIVTPNLNNNIDTKCPMGISVFANAIDVLKGVDLVFDSWCNEYQLGRKRPMIPMNMAKIQMSADGTGGVPVFDPNDQVFYAYEPEDEKHDGFHDISPDIRAEDHLSGLRTSLSMLSFKCGMGANRYEFDKHAGVKTATEVISEQSDLYQSLCKHELVLGRALTGLAHAMLALAGTPYAGEVKVSFDDSIIQDKPAQRAEARDEVMAGLMSKWRYLTEVAGMSEADAKTELDRIRDEGSVSAEAMDLFSTRTGG